MPTRSAGAAAISRTWAAGCAALLAVTTMSASVAAAGTDPAFDLTPLSGAVGASITITNGGCSSEQTAGDAIALYRAADGALVDESVQLGNDPANRRPWTTDLTVESVLLTPSGATQATTPGQYVVALFCDIGSSFRVPSDPDFPTSPADADLTKPFTVTGGEPDVTPPATSVTRGLPNNAWATAAAVRFGYASNEPEPVFECVLDGSATACPASGVTFRSLSQRTHVFTVAARDLSGNIDASAVRRTFTVPRNNDTLTHGSGWAKRSGPGYYLGTFSQSTRKGSQLRLGVRGVKRLALVATEAPRNGTVRVFLGKTRLRTVSLAAATSRKGQVVPVATFARKRTGTVRIVVATAGRTVRVEGLGVATR